MRTTNYNSVADSFQWTPLLLFIFFFSCHTPPPEKYQGYSNPSPDLFYKLQSFDDSKQKAQPNEFLKLAIVYKTLNDSVFLTTQNQNPVGKIIYSAKELSDKGVLGRAIMQMNEGDSITFITNVVTVFNDFLKAELPLFLKKEEDLKVDMRLESILNKEEYEREIKKYEEILSVWEVEENLRIKKYINNNNLQSKALLQPNGMYYIPLAVGHGAIVDTGTTVMINYKGYFMDAQQFDATEEGHPFELTIGDEFQLISGLQYGIKLMREGEKTKFIIPSYLAFGWQGSSTGIVPPNTTVVYDVELIKIK